jgi:hypothetical protein
MGHRYGDTDEGRVMRNQQREDTAGLSVLLVGRLAAVLPGQLVELIQ